MSEKLEQIDQLNDTRANSAWFDTPNDWNCPVCKRHKTELIRPDTNGLPFASLEDHHDHISNFIKVYAKEVVDAERPNTPVTNDEDRFLKHRLLPFLERFSRTLICGDCNAADSAAKDQLGDVCKFFSFSPREIQEFIEISPNRHHRIMHAKVRQVFSDIGPRHAERKSIAESWIRKALLDGQHWAEVKSGPSRAHYRTLCRAVKSFEQNIADDWDTLMKGTDYNLGIPHSEKARQKAQRNAERRLSGRQQKHEQDQSGENVKAKTPKRSQATNSKPARANQPWSPEEGERLTNRFKSGASISQIALEFERTYGAIRSRLKKLGLVEE